MSPGGTAFVRRALLFINRARSGRYPTARWLAEEEEISLPTARRVIYRLRDDYGAPLNYSDVRRGWELTHKDWSFAAAGLADRRELVALAFAIDLGQASADPELEAALETFWLRLAERLDTSRTGLDRLATSFSSDRTDRSVLRDPLVIDLIEATAACRVVRFDYQSPWKDGPAAVRTARPLHVRSTDGAAYLLAQTDEGDRVFNLAFIDHLEVTRATFEPPEGDRDWTDTFGIWTGQPPVEVELRIASPGARYFAGQQWHPAQQDRWDGDVLVRRLSGHSSPELVRRLLGLGRFLLAVEPESLRAEVVAAAGALLGNLTAAGLPEAT